mmetsp:Transcript_2329/g.15499  ORF Transcript_2329/g.15499 Transcript_2329/m.15499 type:complete len:246 (+) Transcript_2329:1011-1748(+)
MHRLPQSGEQQTRPRAHLCVRSSTAKGIHWYGQFSGCELCITNDFGKAESGHSRSFQQEDKSHARRRCSLKHACESPGGCIEPVLWCSPSIGRRKTWCATWSSLEGSVRRSCSMRRQAGPSWGSSRVHHQSSHGSCYLGRDTTEACRLGRHMLCSKCCSSCSRGCLSHSAWRSIGGKCSCWRAGICLVAFWSFTGDCGFCFARSRRDRRKCASRTSQAFGRSGDVETGWRRCPGRVGGRRPHHHH